MYPAGAHHGKGGHAGGGETNTSATVLASGGLVTPAGAPQPVEVVNDNKNKLQLQAKRDADGRLTFQVKIDLTQTQSNALVPGQCTGDTDLIAELIDSVHRRNFLLQVDNNNLGEVSGGQNGHRLELSWGELDPNGLKKHFKLLILGPKVTGGPAVGTPRMFEFTEGTVKVADKTSQVKDHTELICPNRDAITVTVKFP